jgi:hypothetical protein
LLAASSGSKGVFRIALQLGLLTGILVFTLHEQLIPLILSQRIAPLTSLVTFCLNFLFISLVGAGIGAVAMRSRRLTFPVELTLALGAVTLAQLLLSDSTGGIAIPIVTTVSSLLALSAGLWCVHNRRSDSRVYWLLGAAISGILLIWVRIAPEQSAYEGSFVQTALHNAFLASLVGSGFVIRLQFRARAWFEISACVVLLVVIAGLQAIGDQEFCERPTRRIGTPTPAKPPNVLFIVLDTVRRQNLSIYGYSRQTTPFLETLAETSAVYSNAVSVASWTLPSHSSMFTGLYPLSHGAHKFETRATEPSGKTPGLLAEHLTLAEILRDQDYQTAGISANLFVGPSYGLDQGFDYFCNQQNPFLLVPSPRIMSHSYLVDWLRDSLPVSLTRVFAMPHGNAERVIDAGLSWIDSLNSEDSFFLFLNLMDAHDPVMPPPHLNDRFSGFTPELYGVWYSELTEVLRIEDRELNREEREHLASQYDASIAYIDQQLARLAAELDERRLFDSLVLVITSDHGEAFGEHDILGHGRELYGELIDIPLLVRFPGGARAGSVTHPFENRKLFDLIRSAVGISVQREATPWESAAEAYPNWTEDPRDQQVRRAFRFESFKYTDSSDGHEELYDLSRDPEEIRNIASEAGSAVETGRGLARSFLDQTPRSDRNPESETTTLEAADRLRLRALGYIE